MTDTTSATSSLGRWLAERCREQGLSLRQAATKTGLSHATINAIITGGSSASAVTIRKLAESFGGDGKHGLVLEDKLLALAGYRTPRGEEGLSEPLAQIIDKLSKFSGPQLKLVEHFADFIHEMRTK